MSPPRGMVVMDAVLANKYWGLSVLVRRLLFMFPSLVYMTFCIIIIVIIIANPRDVQAAETDEVAETANITEMQTSFVSRAVFAHNIQDHEPIDIFTTMTDGIEHVFFYTDLRNLIGHTVRHRWIHNGIVYSEISFDVRAKRWRIWSSKSMHKDLFGLWEVRVVDENGRQLARKFMHYLP
ncbi:MAG: DUF2914 domain-containing protein [Mariprofundales bacterium]